MIEIIALDQNSLHGGMDRQQRASISAVWESRQCRKSHTYVCKCYGFVRRTPRIPAILTKSANDLAPIFFIRCPRWLFTVISARPISAAICLLRRPPVTKASTSCSRGVSESKIFHYSSFRLLERLWVGRRS